MACLLPDMSSLDKLKLKARMFPIASKKALVTLGAGLALALFGLLFVFLIYPPIFREKVAQKLRLDDNSEAFNRWKTLPFPLFFKVYIFNVTNAAEVQQGGSPVVEEVGPYVYDLYKTKTRIEEMENDTFSYYLKESFVFNKNESGDRTEDDEVVTLNSLIVGTAVTVERMFPAGLSFLNSAIPFLFPGIEDAFVKAKVGDLLFKGILIQCNYTRGPPFPICNALKTRAPPTVLPLGDTKNYVFSYFGFKNNTEQGPYQVKRGRESIYDVGKLVGYKNKTELDVWGKNTSCNDIRGTDSTIFPPIIGQQPLYIFVPEVCSSLFAQFLEEDEFDGVPVYSYIASPENFADAESRPELICRCIENDDSKLPPHCLKRGVFDASKCQKAPVIVSNPHFLGVDSEYTKYAKGLHAEPLKHLTKVSLEPNTGVVVEGKKRMQMNIFLKKMKDIDVLTNVSEGLFPLIWVEEGKTIDHNYLQPLRSFIEVKERLDQGKWIFVVAGLLCSLIGVLFIMKEKGLTCLPKESSEMNEMSFTGPSARKPNSASHSVQKPSFDIPNVPNREDASTFPSKMSPERQTPVGETRTRTLPR